MKDSFFICHMKKREDLALRYLLWEKDKGIIKSVRINNRLLKQWGITEEVLKKDAWKNMKEKFPPTVCTMEKALEQVFDEEVEERNNGIETVDTEDFMYIVSNKMCFHGASYMFAQDFMGNLAEKFKDDLIILPSSVHEIIFMKRQNIEKMEGLIDMVRKVNDSQFLPEDVLSNNIYIYDRNAQKTCIFKPGTYQP